MDGIYNQNSKKLNRTIHTILAKNQILQHENNNLREALANEKRRGQRGKALLLQPLKDYDGGAIFWSPNKVAEARQRQEQKDLQEQEQQLQKKVRLLSSMSSKSLLKLSCSKSVVSYELRPRKRRSAWQQRKPVSARKIRWPRSFRSNSKTISNYLKKVRGKAPSQQKLLQ